MCACTGRILKRRPLRYKSPSTSICKISSSLSFPASNSRPRQRAHQYHFRLWIMCLIILFAATTLIVANELRRKRIAIMGTTWPRYPQHTSSHSRNYFKPHSGSISRCIMQTKSLCPKQRHPLSYYISNQTLYKISCSSVRI